MCAIMKSQECESGESMGALIYHTKSKIRYEHIIDTAACVLREGGLVVFPTETVYGIGCNALDAEAVKKLYLAKQRPLDKPLLLHLHDIAQAESYAFLDDRASLLLSAFTPGPLSVIAKKRETVPYEVTAGGETVGLRFPSNRLFLDLAKKAGVPIAATSANLSGLESAKDGKAAAELSEIADVIIDDGECSFSIESTIVSLVSDTPKLLRIGAISKERIEEVVGICD